jgi:excisionase family DNA binding protein
MAMLDYLCSQMPIEEPKTEKLLVTVPAAAEVLSVARSKVYAMVQAGELPAVRLGKSLRIPVRALTEYVQRRTA